MSLPSARQLTWSLRLQRNDMELAGERVLLPCPDTIRPRVKAPHLRKWKSPHYGWCLPNGLMLFLFAARPGRPVEGGLSFDRLGFGGFIGEPAGYAYEVM